MEPRRRKRPTQVLVLGGEQLDAIARAAAALDDFPPIRVRRVDDGIDVASTTDVVLSDRIVSMDEIRDVLARRRRRVGHVCVGVALSPESSPESSHASPVESTSCESVMLPADATAREIRIACVLVADAIRWRRRFDARSQKEKRLRRLSLADPLTGVGNLRAWNARLSAACRRVRDDGAAVCVALFDVDHFKLVNDARGHATGDEILCAVAQRLAASVREGDFVARLGGDEFGLILGNSTAEQAGKIVERVRQDVSSTIASSSGDEICVTASAGWCSIAATDAGDAVIQRADVSMRAAKRLGRNRTQPPESAATDVDGNELDVKEFGAVRNDPNQTGGERTA